MQWRGRRESSNVEDRRGISGGGLAIGGGIVGVIFVLVKFLLGGGDVSDLQQLAPQQQQMTQEQKAAEDKEAAFVKVVLADTEDVWSKLFSDMGRTYTDPTLVLFNGTTVSGCGNASAQTGPFYCPTDGKLYIDLSFAQQLSEQFGASGEFAMAYVVAHEVGHHVQNLLGEMNQRSQVRGRERQNAASIQTELQADCYAGVWAHSTEQRDLLQSGDVEEGLRAAAAVGDDTLQRETEGRVSPETWTHGSSEQRVHWFQRGYTSGSLDACDTRGESAR